MPRDSGAFAHCVRRAVLGGSRAVPVNLLSLGGWVLVTVWGSEGRRGASPVPRCVGYGACRHKSPDSLTLARVKAVYICTLALPLPTSLPPTRPQVYPDVGWSGGLERRGDDLHSWLELDVFSCLLGGTVPVHTVRGRRLLDVPPGEGAGAGAEEVGRVWVWVWGQGGGSRGVHGCIC